jgi:hypothetical protein
MIRFCSPAKPTKSRSQSWNTAFNEHGGVVCSTASRLLFASKELHTEINQ